MTTRNPSKTYNHTDDNDARSSSAANKYGNLNLNGSHKCSTAGTSKNLRKLGPEVDKRAGYGNSNHASDSKNAKAVNLGKRKSYVGEYGSTTSNSKSSKEDRLKKPDGTTLKSSTLSLHIAAYENYIEERDKERPKIKAKKMDELTTARKWQTMRRNCEPTSGSAEAFETPRQQQEGRQRPEVMEFKASQQLFKPNQGVPDSSKMPVSTVAQQSTQQSTTNAKTAGPLPFGWECRKDQKSGHYFFVDHPNKKVQWEDPRTKERLDPKLPVGWDMQIINGNPVYCDHDKKKTSYLPPRTDRPPPSSPQPSRIAGITDNDFLSPQQKAIRDRRLFINQMFGPVEEDHTPQSSTLSAAEQSMTSTSAEFSSSSPASPTSKASNGSDEGLVGGDNWRTLPDYSKNSLFNLVFHEDPTIDTEMLPDMITVPTAPGDHVKVFSIQGVNDVRKSFHDDRVPYKGKPRYANFMIEDNNGLIKSTEIRKAGIITQAQCYTATHYNSAETGIVITKHVSPIFSATTPSSRTPQPGTRIVVHYQIKKYVPSLPGTTSEAASDLPGTTSEAASDPLVEFASTFNKAAAAFQMEINSATSKLQQQMPQIPIPKIKIEMPIVAPSSIAESRDHHEFDFDLDEPSVSHSADQNDIQFDPPSSAVNVDQKCQPPTKRRRLDNKVHVRDYHFALNTKLDNVLLVVPHGSDAVREFSKSSGGKKNTYYSCLGCARLKSDVKSSAVLEKGGNLWVDLEHSCEPVPMTKHLKEQADRKSRKMVADGVKPRNAHDIFFKQTANMGIDIAEYDKYRRQYSRWRGAYLPACVPGKIAEDFHYLYPPSKKERWLLFETKDVTGFASDLQLRTMAEAEILQTDATFGTCPVGFKQYLTIHALVGGNNGKEWQPVFMAVMNGKTEAMYDLIFSEIKKYWTANNITPKFGRILSDYEPALQKALLKFDAPEKVWGCSFHYSQALLRAVRKFGLMQYYSVFEKKDFPESWMPIRTWIRSIMALPLLPVAERNFIWDAVLKHPPVAPEGEPNWPSVADLQKFVKYVEDTWFTQPHNTWCFFGGGRVKNTNRAESWNSVIAKLYDHKPKLNVFIHDQMLLFSKAEKRIEALNGGEKAKAQQPKYKTLVDRILVYEDEYAQILAQSPDYQTRVEMNLRHLRRVQYLLHDIRNKSGNTMKSKKFATVQARAEESVLWNADLGVQRQEVGGGDNVSAEDGTDGGIYVEDNGFDEIDAFTADDFDAADLEKELSDTMQGITEIGFAEHLEQFNEVERDHPEVIDLAADEEADTAKNLSDASCMYVPHNPWDRATVDKEVFFQPPALAELEYILERLHLDPALAENSPLLGHASMPVDELSFFAKESVGGDGNCCWRAVSYLLTGSQDYYWELRSAAFAELRDYADLIRGIKTDEVRDEYAQKCEKLEKLAKGQVDADFWAGTTELLGLASLLQLNIIVFNPQGSNGQPFFTRCSPLGLRYCLDYPSIFLWASPLHYEPIVAVITENV